MISTRGMTLVEVLAALALLSLVLSALVPLFREAASLSGSRSTGGEVTLFDLAMWADALLQQEDASWRDLPEGSSTLVLSPADTHVPEITVRRLRAPGDEALGRGWWVFESADLAVVRWVPADPEVSPR